uniref:Uncharacterized protein n=1 Tax=Dunaliella tertiolecta TaxID=3047 RepID=A0A7S3QLI2_DUNTE
MTLSGLASVCFALLLACPNRLVAGVKPTYDETRWTKVEWSKWKLPFPHGLGTGDTSPLLAAYPELSEVEQSSLDGPYGRSIPEELANSALMLGLEGFDDEDMIPAAAAALQCVTCHAMVTTAWQRMATDVLSLAFHALDSKEWKDISDGRRQRVYMRDACRREVTRAVLMRNSIAKIEGSTQSGQDLIFVVIRSRQAAASSSTPMQESPSGFSSSQGTKGSVSGSSNANSDGSDSVDSKSGGSSERGGDSPPTYAEKAAVQMACKKLLQEPAGTAVADAIAAEGLP